jgi:hypothetical protein
MRPTRKRCWKPIATRRSTRRGHNIGAVAVANKLARIVWAVWTEGRAFTAARPAA